jgi:hypothetical protein
MLIYYNGFYKQKGAFMSMNLTNLASLATGVAVAIGAAYTIYQNLPAAQPVIVAPRRRPLTQYESPVFSRQFNDSTLPETQKKIVNFVLREKISLMYTPDTTMEQLMKELIQRTNCDKDYTPKDLIPLFEGKSLHLKDPSKITLVQFLKENNLNPDTLVQINFGKKPTSKTEKNQVEANQQKTTLIHLKFHGLRLPLYYSPDMTMEDLMIDFLQHLRRRSPELANYSSKDLQPIYSGKSLNLPEPDKVTVDQFLRDNNLVPDAFEHIDLLIKNS